jgi:2,3-bisphosphoglycerate-independent phosphoglycerate mutase
MNSLRFLFIFLDGIGLGRDDPLINPFSKASLPCLDQLLEGRRLVVDYSPSSGERYSLVSLDATLGVEGMPQSATGQAVLLTGRNIPLEIGYHYGPKPNQEIASIITNGNLFSRLIASGKRASFLNAYPDRFFDAIHSRRRILSSIPLAVTSAGIPLRNSSDLYYGMALSADFTGKSWREHLGMADAPILSPFESGRRLARLAQHYDFSFFEYWMSDYAGHAQEMPWACEIIEELDGVLCGLLSSWKDEEGIIFLTSDHGNLEDLSTHRHTFNPVPGLVVGDPELRNKFISTLHSITDVTPAILNFLKEPG